LNDGKHAQADGVGQRGHIRGAAFASSSLVQRHRICVLANQPIIPTAAITQASVIHGARTRGQKGRCCDGGPHGHVRAGAEAAAARESAAGATVRGPAARHRSAESAARELMG